MKAHQLYAHYTHASCRQMVSCAIAALQDKLGDDPEMPEKDVELLREVIQRMGSEKTQTQIR